MSAGFEAERESLLVPMDNSEADNDHDLEPELCAIFGEELDLCDVTQRFADAKGVVGQLDHGPSAEPVYPRVKLPAEEHANRAHETWRELTWREEVCKPRPSRAHMYLVNEARSSNTDPAETERRLNERGRDNKYPHLPSASLDAWHSAHASPDGFEQTVRTGNDGLMPAVSTSAEHGHSSAPHVTLISDSAALSGLAVGDQRSTVPAHERQLMDNDSTLGIAADNFSLFGHHDTPLGGPNCLLRCSSESHMLMEGREDKPHSVLPNMRGMRIAKHVPKAYVPDRAGGSVLPDTGKAQSNGQPVPFIPGPNPKSRPDEPLFALGVPLTNEICKQPPFNSGDPMTRLSSYTSSLPC